MRRMFQYFVAACCIALTSWSLRSLAMAQQESPATGFGSTASSIQKLAGDEESPLLVEPKTPEATYDAIVLSVDLARPQLARRYLQRLMEMQPDAASLLRMRDAHGPASFLKLANIEALQPMSTQLLEQMQVAFREWANDPARISSLIDELDGTPRQRELAVIQLRTVGPPVVPRLLNHISAQEGTRQHDIVLYTLTRLGSFAIPPILGALHAPTVDMKTTAIEALGWVGTRDLVPHLLHPAFSADEPPGVQMAAQTAISRILRVSVERVREVSSFGAAAELRDLATSHLLGQHEWPVDDDGTVAVWSWNDDSATVAVTKMSPEAASLFTGTQLARQALSLSPENSDIHALYLALAFATDARQSGWDRPLPTGPGTAHDLALVAGADAVADVLRQSLEYPNPASAIGALRVLGKIGTRRQLTSAAGKRSPMIAALNYPDSRVQFVAARTILELDPNGAFSGSQRVVDVLSRAVNDGGLPRSVVIDANSVRGGSLAAAMRELGYDPILALTGREGFKLAAERGDVDLILLQMNCIRWELSQTIVNLRADARTAGIPIVIYGESSANVPILNLTERYPLVTYILETTNASDLNVQLAPFFAKLRTPPLTASQRRERRANAVGLLAWIAQNQNSAVFDIAPTEDALFAAVNDEQLAGDALFALAAIPRQSVQVRLQEVALNQLLAVRLREQASLLLALHIQRFGVLLSENQIREVHQGWELAIEPELKTALASVIGSLRPNSREVSQRLQKYPLSVTPSP